MAYFTEIGDNNIISRVIVAEQDFIDTQEGTWVETSKDTRNGIHYSSTLTILEDGNGIYEADGGTPLRKNFAGVGYIYDAIRDAFYEPQPFPSWTLKEDTCQWESPVGYPDDGKDYHWDESITNWVETE